MKKRGTALNRQPKDPKHGARNWCRSTLRRTSLISDTDGQQVLLPESASPSSPESTCTGSVRCGVRVAVGSGVSVGVGAGVGVGGGEGAVAGGTQYRAPTMRAPTRTTASAASQHSGPPGGRSHCVGQRVVPVQGSPWHAAHEAWHAGSTVVRSAMAEAGDCWRWVAGAGARARAEPAVAQSREVSAWAPMRMEYVAVSQQRTEGLLHRAGHTVPSAHGDPMQLWHPTTRQRA